MSKIYLFDWGDTLMVDFPDQSGKMCDWLKIQAVDGAMETLQALASDHQIYVATNAASSTEIDIKSAFERVGLSPYISGYFCKANLGIGKGSPEFFHKIIEFLDVEPNSIVMVGDSYDKDIEPAIQAGIQAIWFNLSGELRKGNQSVRQVTHLSEIRRLSG